MEKYYKTHEVAKKSGITRQGLWKAIKEGRITGIRKMLGMYIFTDEDIKRIKKIIKYKKKEQ